MENSDPQATMVVAARDGRRFRKALSSSTVRSHRLLAAESQFLLQECIETGARTEHPGGTKILRP